jgi:phage repressor protein C with HTH and peptisase S24 domain
VETRLKALGLTANAASALARKPDAVRNLKRAVKNGDRTGITTGTLAALAPVLETTASWLISGRDEPTSERPIVRVMGRIGAGAEIMPEHEQVPPEGLYEIETMVPVPEGSIAFEVEGDSMWPRYDPGDVILCWKQGTEAEEVIGWEAALMTSDGKRYLKRIVRGSTEGTFDLESHNAPPIRNVKLEWVAHVGMVVRSGQWKRLTTKERGRLMKKGPQ